MRKSGRAMVCWGDRREDEGALIELFEKPEVLALVPILKVG